MVDDAMRNKHIGHIVDILGKSIDCKKYEIELLKKFVYNTEGSIYKDCMNDPPIKYITMIGRFVRLIKNGYTDSLITKDLSRFVHMQLNDIDTTIHKDIYDFKKKREQQEITIEVSQYIQCPKCHGRKCREIESQLRSSDEGGTSRVICLTCGHKRKL
jgi:DNA-directed RNA polymerase subunit M/transcription elongation factor TFIIS